jgi:hypothetical protein
MESRMREIRTSGLMKGNNEKGIAYNRHSLFSILLSLESGASGRETKKYLAKAQSSQSG